MKIDHVVREAPRLYPRVSTTVLEMAVVPAYAHVSAHQGRRPIGLPYHRILLLKCWARRFGLSSEHPLDVTLMKRIAQGDQEAFAQFYDHHASCAYGLILRILRGATLDAQEVLQETFWQVWKDAGKYDPSRSLPHIWLCLLARSRALDHLRRKQVATDRPTDQPDDKRQDPSHIAQWKESNQQTHLAIGKLPEEQATCIELAFFRGLTHLQIAQEQKLPLGTVKTRIRLGMYKLRSILQEETV